MKVSTPDTQEMELNPRTTQRESENKIRKTTSRKLIGITVYFMVLLGVFIGYKLWLFFTNLALLKAIDDPSWAEGGLEPLHRALVTAIPSMVPVVLYLVLLPGMVGARMYDYYTGKQRGPRRRLVVMTIVLVVSGVCLTIQVATYIFTSTLQYLNQIPLNIECVFHLSNTPVTLMSNQAHLYICNCYIPGLGPQTLFTTNPYNLTIESLKEVGLNNMYSTESSINVTQGLQLMGSYYRMLPHMKSMTSLLQVYVVLVALKLPIYLLLNNFQEDQKDLEAEAEIEAAPQSDGAISRQSSATGPSSRISTSISEDVPSFTNIKELNRLTVQLKRLSTMRNTVFSPFGYHGESTIRKSEDLPDTPETQSSVIDDTPSADGGRGTLPPVLRFMFPFYSSPTKSTAPPVTDAEVQEARILVSKLKQNVMVTFAIEICYHGFVELVDAYSLCDEIIKHPDYFKSNIALTYGILTCLTTALFVFTAGNFFVTHPGKSLTVNKLLKAALLTVSNLPAFIIRCYLFWGFSTMESMAGQIGSVFLLFTIKEIAVLILGVAELISVWRSEIH